MGQFGITGVDLKTADFYSFWYKKKKSERKDLGRCNVEEIRQVGSYADNRSLLSCLA